MKAFFSLIFVFAMLTVIGCSAEELMFFADDQYKAIGQPVLKASAINPFLQQGKNSTLRIVLANVGQPHELIPNRQGENKSDVYREAREELHNVDAINLVAKLSSRGSVAVTTEPHRLDLLPSGGVAFLDFNITPSRAAEGWYSLPLDLVYEHQIDVKVSNGSISSLYRPANVSQRIAILVGGSSQSLKVEGASTDLYPGANGTIVAAIKNAGGSVARNCTARLLASPPFRPATLRVNLGDLKPGETTIAKLPSAVDDEAQVREYLLASEIVHDNQTALVSIPVMLGKKPAAFPGSHLIIAAAILALVLVSILGYRRGLGRRGAIRSLRRGKSRR